MEILLITKDIWLQTQLTGRLEKEGHKVIVRRDLSFDADNEVVVVDLHLIAQDSDFRAIRNKVKGVLIGVYSHVETVLAQKAKENSFEVFARSIAAKQLLHLIRRQQ